MKKISIMLMVLVFCLCTVTAVNAQPLSPRLVDDADLLSSAQENALLSDLDELSEKWQMDVVIVTADVLYGYSVEDYSDSFYAQGGYASDGILLLVSMEDQDVIITPYADAITAFTNDGCEYILDRLTDKLSDGEYNEAFDIFVQQCDSFLEQAQSGEPYDVGNLPKEPFHIFKSLIISLVIGLVLALIVTGIMRGQLKSVRGQSAADNYVKSGSLNITYKQDLFLYRNVTRREKPKSNSGGGGRSSSGGGRAGAKGKF